jgi:hypothetical protein
MTVSPPLTLPVIVPVTRRSVVQGLLKRIPRSDTLGAVARQPSFAKTVLELFDGDLHEVTNADFQFALIAQEFFEVNVAFRLETGIDHDEILVNTHDFGRDDLAGAHLLTAEAFLEKVGKAFFHGGIV